MVVLRIANCCRRDAPVTFWPRTMALAVPFHMQNRFVLGGSHEQICRIYGCRWLLELVGSCQTLRFISGTARFISGTSRWGRRQRLGEGVFAFVFSTSETDFGVLALAKMREVADNS